MSERQSVHLLQVGEELEPLEFTVSPELNQQYLYGEEDYHPRYISGSETFGEPIVHVGLLLNMSNYTRSPSYYLDAEFGAIHAAEETIFYNTAQLGKKLTVTWKVSKIYEKRNRPYQEIDVFIIDEDGTLILQRNLICTYASMELVKK